MRNRPLDHRGYPVPWFVAWILKGETDGKEWQREVPINTPGARPDFRIMGRLKRETAHNEKRCWLCGERLGAWKSFVIGPMCLVNRVSSEPPSHTDCAVYGATACPFLTMPKMERRADGLPAEGLVDPGGIALSRNPGVAVVWTTTRYRKFSADDRGFSLNPDKHLFELATPDSIQCFAQGRAATLAEVVTSIESGLPVLQGGAEAEGPEAMHALDRMLAAAYALLARAYPEEVA